MRAVALLAVSAATLSSGTARRSLVHKLEHYQGFHSVTAACHRHTAREQLCTWRGRRADGAWRGRATVRRLKGGAIDVRITAAHRG